jgi:hypothetical protein
MNSIWIARDGDGTLMAYFDLPKYDQGEWWGKPERFKELPDAWLPEIKPGECREFVMKTPEQIAREAAEKLTPMPDEYAAKRF